MLGDRVADGDAAREIGRPRAEVGLAALDDDEKAVVGDGDHLRRSRPASLRMLRSSPGQVLPQLVGM
jgi:hypothetical protein